ncbi:MAG: TSUP family transporter [Candidatus Cellulosilyticum pullistercoris]|uniref:Probable membrane transporter protein n=1 Tax=Candidatus Cellulosilyticum pullistercoris TaxID=2838521 RepID=A0A9E2NLX9_9FIRM|nr:TSUP family transporter [Candidatus Cellulosilyticum pullistercoris]
MNELLKMLLIICPLVFTAGFVDAVAGGGGLISLPAYMLAGLPTHQAAGCNKFSASLGTTVAAVNYIKSGKVKFRIAIVAAIGAIIGSSMGTNLALLISDKLLKGMMVVIIPVVAIFLVTQKHLGKEDKGEQGEERSLLVQSIISSIIGLVIGCYDGLIGPGTGTFLMIAFSLILRIDLVTSSGCAKVANLASNLTSVIIYTLGGKVIFMLAIPAAICSMLGGYLGSRFAIKGGSQKVRYVMFVVIGLLFVKTAFEFIQ